MSTTTYFVRAPSARRGDCVPVESPRDAEFLSRRGWDVRAVTRHR